MNPQRLLNTCSSEVQKPNQRRVVGRGDVTTYPLTSSSILSTKVLNENAVLYPMEELPMGVEKMLPGGVRTSEVSCFFFSTCHNDTQLDDLFWQAQWIAVVRVFNQELKEGAVVTQINH